MHHRYQAYSAGEMIFEKRLCFDALGLAVEGERFLAQISRQTSGSGEFLQRSIEREGSRRIGLAARRCPGGAPGSSFFDRP